MIRIAIVDDFEKDIEHLQHLITDYAARKGLCWNLSSFRTGEAFLDSLKPGKYQLVFLDVILDGMDGMETALRLKAIDPDAVLVLVSADAGYAIDGYDMDAAAFLVKGDVQEKHRFERLMQRLEPRLLGSFVLDLPESRTAPRQLPVDTLLYCEMMDHKLNLYTKEKVYTLYLSIKKLKSLLPKDGLFFECHRGIIINLDRIQFLDKQVVIMENGNILPISRRKRPELEAAYASRNFAKLRRRIH